MFKFYPTVIARTALLIMVMVFSPLSIGQFLSNQMDIRVLIDVSGSMKNTDPNNLRIPALQVLAQLLPASSKAGIWQFANQPKVMVPHGLVNSQWHQQASIAAKNISSQGQFTDIGAALKAASFSQQDQALGRQLHVILLTDGMVDVSKDAATNQRARRALLEPILQDYINRGARVHTVGLSHKADKATLSAMAQRTDGSFNVAVNADQLLEIFLRALDNTVITQQVPVLVNKQSFVVQHGVASMTIVVQKNGDENIQFKDGKQRTFGRQQILTNQQWQSSLTHDVVSVQNPPPGTWALISDTAILKRINVVGQLQILLQQSHQNIKVGQRSYIDVQLANEKGNLLTAEQLQGFQLQVTLDDGTDEVFKRRQVFLADKKMRMQLPVLNVPGMYNLTISVAKGQLIRTINRSLRVHPIVAAMASQQNSSNTPATKEVLVLTEDEVAPKLQIEVMLVSNESASPALQALMVSEASDAEAALTANSDTPMSDTPEAKAAMADTQAMSVQVNEVLGAESQAPAEPESAVSQIAKIVEKLKNKVLSVDETTLKTTVPKTNAQVSASATSPQTSYPEVALFSYWKWLIAAVVGMLMLLLWIILRRRSK